MSPKRRQGILKDAGSFFKLIYCHYFYYEGYYFWPFHNVIFMKIKSLPQVVHGCNILMFNITF